MTATTAGVLGLQLLTGLASLALWVIAMGRIAWRESVTWKHGWWSRLAWMLIATLISWTPAPGLLLPLGAIAAIYRTRRRPASSPPDPIPLAGAPARRDVPGAPDGEGRS